MQTYDQTQDTTLRDYLRVLFRHKAVIFTTVVTVCATVYAGLKLKTPVYESQVKMLITAEKQVEATYYREMYGGRNVQQTLTQSEIVKSSPVLNRVARALALDKRPFDDEKQFSSPLKAMLIDYNVKSLNQKINGLSEEQRQGFLFRRAVESLKKSIKVEPIRDTNMFTISARDYNPVGAALIANVVSRSYVMFDLEQQLAELKLKYGEKHPTVNLIKDSIARLNGALDGQPVDDIEAIGPASVKIMEQASVAIGPTGTSKALTFLLAAVMSIFLAVMLAFVFEYTDQTFKMPQDVKRSLNLAVLGSVAKKKFFDKKLIDGQKKQTAYTLGIQALSDHIYMLGKEKGVKSLLIAPVSARDTNPTVTANIGLYMANKLHYKTLIIDADFRDPSMHKIFEISGGTGLAAVLEGEESLENTVHKKGPNLNVLAAGKAAFNPITLLDSDEMGDVLKEAKERYEIVLIHCANIKDAKDAAILAARVDGVALVVNEGASRRQVVQEAVGSLNGKQTNVLGVILNNRTFPIPKFVYDRV